ncbi:MAG: ABC transporter ATP-binding protein [Chitinophagaceae bacterium]|nr:ABC transporter ATP-binding protein [Chitinophagaceae bacterium]
MSLSSIIQINHLSKSYGALNAVNDLNLEVFQGDVYGFLGPNGAGKSTTIRMMLSLITPDEGDIFIFGKKLREHRNEILRNIGCIIEKPDFYLYLSAAKNLELFARLSGVTPSNSKIYETLELVGLRGREKDKVKGYSHGMKQRLGIAQTLIHDPELIILDEPTTGLDPQGIIDVRNLILHLQKDLNKTIFLSSHILSEIELIASRMAILHKGKVVSQGNVAELLSTQELVVSIETSDNEKAAQWITSSAWRSKMESTTGRELHFNLAKNEIPQLTSALQEAGFHLYSVSYKRALEDYFLKLTHHHHDETNRVEPSKMQRK